MLFSCHCDEIQTTKGAFFCYRVTPVADTLIEYAIGGVQPRMRMIAAELRTSERANRAQQGNCATRHSTIGGQGGEERRSVARPPKVKSRGGTQDETEGNRRQLLNENIGLRVNRELERGEPLCMVEIVDILSILLPFDVLLLAKYLNKKYLNAYHNESLSIQCMYYIRHFETSLVLVINHVYRDYIGRV